MSPDLGRTLAGLAWGAGLLWAAEGSAQDGAGVQAAREAIRINGRATWGYRVTEVRDGPLLVAGLLEGDFALADDWEAVASAMAAEPPPGAEHMVMEPMDLTVARPREDGSPLLLDLTVFPHGEQAYREASAAWTRQQEAAGAYEAPRELTAGEQVLLALAGLYVVAGVKRMEDRREFLGHPLVQAAIANREADPETYARYCLRQVTVSVGDPYNNFSCFNSPETDRVWADLCTGELGRALHQCGFAPVGRVDYPDLPD